MERVNNPPLPSRGGLIVDFPRQCRRPSASSSMHANSGSCPLEQGAADPAAPAAREPQPPRRSVRFAETSHMTIVPYPSPSEARRRWYSEAERDALKLSTLRDLRRIARKLATTPLESIGTEELFLCIGVEAMLSPDLHRLIRERKRQHVRSCLLFQARQEMNGAAVDPEALRRHSETSSEWTRTRAQTLAAGYRACLKA